MKKLALITITILSVVIGMLALWQMREAAQLLALGLAVAASITPGVQRLVRRGLPLSRAVAISFGIALLSTVLITALLVLLAYTEAVEALATVPSWYEAARASLVARSGYLGSLGAALPSLSRIAGSLAGEGAEQMGGVLLELAGRIAALAVLIFSVASFGFYWLLDAAHFERLWLSLLPLQVRVVARVMWDEIYREVGIFLRGETSILLVTVLALTSAYEIAGLPGAVSLALLGGLAQVLPLIGLPVALLPALLVALTQNTFTAGTTLVLGLLVLSIIKLVIAPRVFRAGIKVNPVLLVIVIMILADVAGVFFILLGPPLAAAIQVVARVLMAERRQALTQSDAVQVHTLQARLDAIELRADHSSAEYTQIQALLQRARQLVNATGQRLEQQK